MTNTIQENKVLVCASTNCGKPFAAWVPFCPYCAAKQAPLSAEKLAKPVAPPPDVVPDPQVPDAVDNDLKHVVRPEPGLSNEWGASSRSQPSNKEEVPQAGGEKEVQASIEPAPKIEQPKPSKGAEKTANISQKNTRGKVSPEKIVPEPPAPPAKRTWIWMLLLVVVGGVIAVFALGTGAVDKQFKEAQNAFIRKELTQANALVNDVLRQKPDHAAAKEFLAGLQRKLSNHQKLLSTAQSNLLKGRLVEGRGQVEQILLEDVGNKDAANLRQQFVERENQAANSCTQLANAGMTQAGQSDLVQARRSLQAARNTNADCAGIRTLATQISELERSVKAAEDLAAAQRRAQIVTPPPTVSAPIAPHVPAANENRAMSMMELREALTEIRQGNWSTGKKMALQTKARASNDEVVRAEADRVLREADKVQNELQSKIQFK